MFVIKKGTLSIPLLKIFIPAQIAPEVAATICNHSDPPLKVSLVIPKTKEIINKLLIIIY